MTAQLNDTVFHRDATYSLVGICKSSGGLFEPAAHNLDTEPIGSACLRGYVAGYAVIGGSLVLRNLSIRLKQQKGSAAPLPTLFSVAPQKHELPELFGGALKYDDLDEPIAFSGGLLLGRDFIGDLYVHMGFHPAWKYAEVWELVLEDGRVTGEFDRSADVKAQREHLAALPLRPAHGSSREDVEAWISTCFSREYKR